MTTQPPRSAEPERVALAPCPFCGGVAKLVSHRVAEDAEMAAVECTSCLAATDRFEDAYAPTAEAIAAWNRRPAQPAPGASELADLKRRIDIRLNNHLCDMREGWDDSISGFNDAWDIVRKVFNEVLAATATAPATADGWRDISSAPRDGTKVLGAEGATGFIGAMWWTDTFSFVFNEETLQSDYVGAWTDGAVLSWAMEETASYRPTHWRPLPPPPASKESES